MDTLHFAIIAMTLTILIYMCQRMYHAKSKNY
jgi:hypothetical protein